MSLAASDAEEWGGSGGEPKVLPPFQTLRPKPDAELIRILSKAVEDLGLEWSAPEEPAHSLLDEWYLPGSRQQSSSQCPAPFLPAVQSAAHGNRPGSANHESNGAGDRQEHGQFGGAGGPPLVKPH